MDPVDLFLATPLLAAIGTDRALGLWRLAGAPRRYGRGRVIRLQDDPAASLPVLLTGRVSATYLTPAGDTVVLADVPAPAALDKVAVLDGAGHTATWTAATDCLVASVPREPVLAAIAGLPEANAHVLRVLTAQARAQRDHLVLTSLPGRRRVAHWLATRTDGRPGLVRLPGGQGELAKALGVTRVTVNRALKDLERRGAVRTVAGGVEVLDVGELDRLGTFAPM